MARKRRLTNPRCYRCGKRIGYSGKWYCKACEKKLKAERNPAPPCSKCGASFLDHMRSALYTHSYTRRKPKTRNPFIGSTDPHVRALRRRRRRLARRGLLNPKRRRLTKDERARRLTADAFLPFTDHRRRWKAGLPPRKRRRRALNPSEASIMRKAMKAAWRKIKAHG